MARKKLEEPRIVQEKETLYVEWEYGAEVQSMIEYLIQVREGARARGAIPKTIRVEMETHYGY